jgi:hypothetical protein
MTLADRTPPPQAPFGPTTIPFLLLCGSPKWVARIVTSSVCCLKSRWSHSFVSTSTRYDHIVARVVAVVPVHPLELQAVARHTRHLHVQIVRWSFDRRTLFPTDGLSGEAAQQAPQCSLRRPLPPRVHGADPPKSPANSGIDRTQTLPAPRQSCGLEDGENVARQPQVPTSFDKSHPSLHSTCPYRLRLPHGQPSLLFVNTVSPLFTRMLPDNLLPTTQALIRPTRHAAD